MSNFDLLFPVTPFKKVFPSSKMRELDDRWPKIPNWIDGSTHTLAAGQTVELLKGDNLSAFVLNLKVGIVDTITIAPDAALVLSASSGHPSAAIWQGFSTATFESGATLEFQSGAIAGWDGGASAVFASGASLTSQAGSTCMVAGRRARGARVVLTAVVGSPYTQTISLVSGNRFELPNAPANTQVIKIASTSPTPDANETIELLLPGPCATGKIYEIRRADGTLIAEFWGNAAGDAGAWAEFEFAGGVWRLGANGGGGSAGGVLSGIGA